MIKTEDSLDNFTNPLVNYSNFFPYGDFKTEHIKQCIDWIEKFAIEQLTNIENDCSQPSFENTVLSVINIGYRCYQAWIPVVHLVNVNNQKMLRKPYAQALQRLVKLNIRLSQSKVIYDKLKKIKQSQSYKSFSDQQKRSLDKLFLSMKHAGVELSEDDQKIFEKYSKQLSQYSMQFSNNLIDSVKDYKLVVKDKDLIDGLGFSTLQSLSDSYSKVYDQSSNPDTGPWLINLDDNIFHQILKYCNDRGFRKKIYQDYYQKNAQGRFNNSDLIKHILDLRFKLSKLLRYDNPVKLSLDSKMANTIEEINDLHRSVKKPCLEANKKFLNQLQQLLNQDLNININKDNKKADYVRQDSLSLQDWDVGYYTVKLKAKLFDYNSNIIKEYLELEQVLKGMWKLFDQLFGITIVQKHIDNEYLWEKEVMFFHLYNSKDNKLLAYIFLDLYARPGFKKSGAWMLGMRSLHSNGQSLNNKLPIAVVCCNFVGKTKDKPCLLSLSELQTVFHEFGHALQHTLSSVDIHSISGTKGVDRDMVELPSQFFENWCYHKPTLLSFAKHYKTKKPLSDDLYDKIIGSKNVGSSRHFLRQIGYGMIDIVLHSQRLDQDQIFDSYQKIIDDTENLPANPYRKNMLTSFYHIFTGGYAAGYYGYLWAKIISEHAFWVFYQIDQNNDHLSKQEKLKMHKSVGMKFRKSILALGGAMDSHKAYKQFNAESLTIDPFLYFNDLKSS